MENKFLDAIMFRHACKEFDSTKKISKNNFNTILEIGRLSPSSFGFEPWKFLIIQNKSLREKLKKNSWGAQGQLPSASHFIIILSRKKKGMIYDSKYIEDMLKLKQLPEDRVVFYEQHYEKFQKEDFKLLDSNRILFEWACRQTYIAMGNMITGAAYLGIDSCPIEGFDKDKVDEFLSKELNIDTEEFGVSVMTAFGYRKNKPRKKIRQNLKDITTWYK